MQTGQKSHSTKCLWVYLYLNVCAQTHTHTHTHTHTQVMSPANPIRESLSYLKSQSPAPVTVTTLWQRSPLGRAPEVNWPIIKMFQLLSAPNIPPGLWFNGMAWDGDRDKVRQRGFLKRRVVCVCVCLRGSESLKEFTLAETHKTW